MASNDIQSQISSLRDEIARMQQEFADRPMVRSARRYVAGEGAAVAQTARDHPAGLSAVVLAAGLAGLAIGYLLATTQEASPRWSRWY